MIDETDKQIVQRILDRIGHKQTDPYEFGECQELRELSHRLFARCEADEAKPKDELRGKAVEVKRYMPVYSGNDGCWMEECESGGKYVRYSDHLAAMRSRAEGVPDVQELYTELLYAVAKKYPGESRHQTALRYIRRCEENYSNVTQEAAAPSPGEKE